MMNEIAILNAVSQINRAAYQSRQVQQQRKSDRLQENSVTILGYDSATGRYKVKNAAGQVFSARAISNGGFGRGDTVSLSTPIGGIPIIDAMTR